MNQSKSEAAHFDEIEEKGFDGLFRLAESVSRMVAAPVTIEDTSFRVLAYSTGQIGADQARIETIMNRRVPDSYREILAGTDLVSELNSQDSPVYFPARADGALGARVAVSVWAGHELLGSIWAVVSEPLSNLRTQGLINAAKVVALDILEYRESQVYPIALHRKLLKTLLAGDSGSENAAEQLGLRDMTRRVLALGMMSTGSEDHAHNAAWQAEAYRLSDAFSLHLRSVDSSACAAPIDGVVYGVVSVPPPGLVGARVAVDATVVLARDFVESVDSAYSLRVGIGGVATSPAEIAKSRFDADAVLEVLSAPGSPERISTIQQSRIDVMLDRLRKLDPEDGVSADSPIGKLLCYDSDHGSDLTRTLAAYLDEFGDVSKASSAMHLHHNTFRYRLKRLCSVSGLDLSKPAVRFEAMLDLRLYHQRGLK